MILIKVNMKYLKILVIQMAHFIYKIHLLYLKVEIFY